MTVVVRVKLIPSWVQKYEVCLFEHVSITALSQRSTLKLLKKIDAVPSVI